MASRESFGIHDPAYRVGRAELLSWLNDLLQVNYSKVEQCANGAAYCQIMDAIYPGEVPMKRVQFDAKLEHDSMKNYKVLQGVFIKRQINKNIEVEKLIKAKPLDNLEFLQWCKRFFDLNFGGQEYDALERRAGRGSSEAPASSIAAPPARKSPPSKAPGGGVSSGSPGMRRVGAPARQESSPAMMGAGAARAGGRAERPSSAARTGAGAGGGGAAAAEAERERRELRRERDEMQGECRRLREEADELQLTVDTLEKERDFYFHKLREIEVLCLQVQEGKERQDSILPRTMAILYATDDAADPLPDGEDGEQHLDADAEEGAGPLPPDEEEPEEC